MSSETSEQLTDRISAAMRGVIANAVLTNERIARTVGLNVVDLQTFGIVMSAGSPMTAGEISARTELPTSTTTRVLDRLEKAGFVSRAADPADRRKVLVHAEQTRFPELAGAYEQILDEMRRLHEGFTTAELAIVARYLETMEGVGSSS